MTVFLPRDLFPQIHEDPAVNPASRRKVVLPRITRQILERSGYKFGEKIRVPGGYAFEVTDPDGHKLKLGLKTAVNRWLNTATTLVEMVDSVIVTTFEWDDDEEKPVSIELVHISSSDLLKMIGKVQKAAIKEKADPLGHYYMPLDADSIEDDHLGCVAGAVIPAGRVVFGPEKVVWVSEEWGRLDEPLLSHTGHSAPNAPPSSAIDVASVVAEAKANLAARLGIAAEKIDLSIRF
jgi:hypothetical protein